MRISIRIFFYKINRFTNNINMINIIKKFLKIYDELTKTYSIRILTSSITFNLLLVIFPLIMLINTINNSLGLDVILVNESHIKFDGTISSIILIINLLWSSSTLTLSFNQTSDTIYHSIEKRSYIKSRIKSFFLFLLIILLIISALIFIIVINHFIRITSIKIIKYLLYILELVGEFVSVWLITGFVYKKIIPVKVKFKNTLLTSLIITIIWYVLTNICFPVLGYFLIDNYTKIYSSFASIFLIIYYLYLIVYVFICGIIFQYYLYLKKYKHQK